MAIQGPASLRVDTSELEALVKDFDDGLLVLRRTILEVTRRRVLVAEKEAVQKASGRLSDLRSGRALHRRTGRLAASISSRVEEEATAVFAKLGLLKADRLLAYGAAQEFGATIVPKRAKLLTVPLEAALTPTGVPRFTAREAEQFYPEGTFWKTILGGGAFGGAGGIPILFGKKGKKVVPLFVGVKKVVIEPAYFLTSSMNNAADAIQRELQENIAGLLLGQREGA